MSSVFDIVSNAGGMTQIMKEDILKARNTRRMNHALGSTSLERVYFAYQAFSEVHLGLFATHLFDHASLESVVDTSILPATSNIVIEVDASNNVMGWVNDEPAYLIGCSDYACPKETFLNALNAERTYTDHDAVKAQCAA